MPYLFNRSVRLAPGHLLDSMAWAVKMTEKVNDIVDVDVRLWSRVLGPQLGTLAWTTIVTGLAELTAIDEKLMADGGYTDLAEEGARYQGGSGVDDKLVHLVHPDPEGVGSAQYASITTTVLAPGMTAQGIALGTELAQRVKAITGRPTSFGASVTGRYGEVGFISLSDTIDQLQAANEALAEDPEWVTQLDSQASKVFVADATERMITRRLA